MRKHGQPRVELESSTSEQKVNSSPLNKRKRTRQSERKGVTPPSVPFINANEDKKEQIGINSANQRSIEYFDSLNRLLLAKASLCKNIGINPEDIGIDFETFKRLQQNISPTQTTLAHANMSDSPVNNQQLPQRCVEPVKNQIFLNPHIVNVPSITLNDMGPGQQNVRMLPYHFRPSLSSPDLSVKPPNYQKALQPVSYAQTGRRTDRDILPEKVETTGEPLKQIERSIESTGMPQNMHRPIQSSYPTQNFDIQQAKYEEVQMPISYAQTDRRNDTERKVCAGAVFGKRNKVMEDNNEGGNICQTTHPKFTDENFEVDQQNYNEMVPVEYPALNYYNEPTKKYTPKDTFVPKENVPVDKRDYIESSPDNMGVYAEDISPMEQNIDQITQPDPNLDMVKLRYENISPPYQETEINNEPTDMQKQQIFVDDEAPRADYLPIPSNDNVIRGNENNCIKHQNIEQNRNPQNIEMEKHMYDVYSRPNSNALPVENVGAFPEAAGAMQQNIGQSVQPSPKLVDPNFEVDRRRYEELTRPIRHSQAGSVRNLKFPETVSSAGNGHYLQTNNYRNERDVQQNIGQTTQQHFSQNFEMNQQRCGDTAQTIRHQGVPQHFNTKVQRQDPRQGPRQDPRQGPRQDPRQGPRQDPRQVPRQDPRQGPRQDPRQGPGQDPRLGPRNQFTSRHQAPQMNVNINYGMTPQPRQVTQPQQQNFNMYQHRFPQFPPPHNVARGQFLNQYHQRYCSYNGCNYCQNHTNCNTGQPSTLNQQQTSYQHIAMQQQSFYHQCAENHSANSNMSAPQQQQNLSQQQLLQQMQMQQRSYDYYQYQYQNNNFNNKR